MTGTLSTGRAKRDVILKEVVSNLNIIYLVLSVIFVLLLFVLQFFPVQDALRPNPCVKTEISKYVTSLYIYRYITTAYRIIKAEQS